MKPFFALFLAIAVLLLPSCAVNRQSAAQVLDSIVEALIDGGIELPPARHIYLSGAAQGSRSHLSDKLAALLYYGDRDANPREIALLSDFAIRLPDDLSACEIHVLRAANPANRDKIAEMLQRRLDMLSRSEVHLFIPDAFESNIAAGRVVVRGNFVILLITPNNDLAEKGI